MASTAKHRTHDGETENLNFSANPASKRLLDVIVSILADEYIQIAKENPEIFLEEGCFDAGEREGAAKPPR
ncbi:MAG: hypothetical protein K1X28_00150 [Parachlamydiales bacterium]|nr:hypothetical protein [Parachlamydiales bacterium]